MFLLIPEQTARVKYMLYGFKFHYVSINSDELTLISVRDVFNLNSIMFLLIRDELTLISVRDVFNLNSIMFLLIPLRPDGIIKGFEKFKFHYVSINSSFLNHLFHIH